jgi:putative selenate reductase molybdopterin-binding subunit
MSESDVSRREFLQGTGAALAASAVVPALLVAEEQAASPSSQAPRTAIRVTVNGSVRQVEVEDRWTLAELLRNQFNLTGTKLGCDRGECGACTVLLDGTPVYSCSTLAVWADGREVTTVEGLALGGTLSPLQQAFIDHNGPQCGFCTSGQLMTATALAAGGSAPSADAVRRAMTGNLCRCANYNALVEGILAARSGEPVASRASAGLAPLATVGRATPRIDAVERVTGRATYTADIRLPGMLYARVLRSPHPHAHIRRIDTSRAAALPGVRAIITHENGAVWWGAGSISGGSQYNDALKAVTRHRRYTFNNPVRFVGEPVAAVAAETRDIAQEALTLIEVDYEPLPFVMDIEAALQPEATKIWPEGNLSLNTRNEAVPVVSRRGNVEEGFRAADRIFEGRFTTAFVHDAQMEPRAAVAHWEGDKLTVFTPTGGIANCRHDIARDLGLRDDQVRVVCEFMGGNFGNKNQNQDADLIAAVLARETRAPVMLELSRKEDWLGMHGRWHTVQEYRVGVRGDGTLTAITMRALSGMGPYRKNAGGISGIEMYDCPNVETSLSPVYTNRTVSGNFRAPSDPHGFFGVESMMDDVAHELGMDPVEFALRNMTRPGPNLQFTNYSLDACIRRGAELFDWKARWKSTPGSDPGPIKRGAGMSFMRFRAGLGRSSAVVQLDGRGRYTLFVGVTDVGGGAKTTMGMIAAEALGIPLSELTVVSGDTDRCPYSVGESGSRTTMMTGWAVVEAVKDLQRQIAERGRPAGDALLVGTADPSPSTDGKARNCFGAHFVEVEVDTELGRVRILRYVTVHESGRIMNPMTARDQIRGAALQGIGQALHEDLLYDARNGQPLSAGYYGARHLTYLDAPAIEVEFIEVDDGYGPFGAKTVGESGIIPGPAAVANAVSNAIGRRMRDLPMTRDRILGALA